jgi:hypothetical protein
MDRPNRTLPDGRWLNVMPLYGGRGRLGVSPSADCGFYADVW